MRGAGSMIRSRALPTPAVPAWAVGGGAALALLAIAGIDRLLLTHLSLPVAAGLDEPAHVGTAGLLLAALPRVPLRGAAVALGATVAIDVDHLPALLGWHGLALAGERPLTHALWVPLFLLAASRLLIGRGRAVLRWATLGVAIHLVRDAATGGIPAFWPVTADPVRAPHAAYLIALAGCALAALVMRWEGGLRAQEKRG